MKTLEKKVIVFDDNCPLCKLYTNAFVKLGWIKEDNRVAFSELPELDLSSKIDLQKARHFIPLIDLDGGETLYGVDALVHILTQKLFFIRMIMKIPGAEWFFKRLYKMISYNRRIIIPGNACNAKFDCAPDFNLKYRMTFITFAILFSVVLTSFYALALGSFKGTLADNAIPALLTCGTGWMLLFGVAIISIRKNLISYLGHLSVIMMMGLMMLLPFVLIVLLFPKMLLLAMPFAVLISFVLMLREHARRLQFLGMSNVWNLLWVLLLGGSSAAWMYYFMNV